MVVLHRWAIAHDARERDVQHLRGHRSPDMVRRYSATDGSAQAAARHAAFSPGDGMLAAAMSPSRPHPRPDGGARPATRPAGRGERSGCMPSAPAGASTHIRGEARTSVPHAPRGRPLPLDEGREGRARGDRQLARTAAAQRGLGNARPVAALVTRVPRANARCAWLLPGHLTHVRRQSADPLAMFALISGR